MSEERRQYPRVSIPEQAEEDTVEPLPRPGDIDAELRGVRPGPGPELARESDVDDVLDRSADERYDTPRRYEEDHDEPALPADDATLGIKI